MLKQLERCKNPKREEVKCGRKGEKLDIPLPHLGGTWEGRLAGDFCSEIGQQQVELVACTGTNEYEYGLEAPPLLQNDPNGPILRCWSVEK